MKSFQPFFSELKAPPDVILPVSGAARGASSHCFHEEGKARPTAPGSAATGTLPAPSDSALEVLLLPAVRDRERFFWQTRRESGACAAEVGQAPTRQRSPKHQPTVGCVWERDGAVTSMRHLFPQLDPCTPLGPLALNLSVRQ